MPPRLPKNLKITFEKSPPPRPEPEPLPEPLLSPEVETVLLDEPDEDVIDEMVPQFKEKAPPVESDIFAKPEPKAPAKPPSILVVAGTQQKGKLTKTGKIRKEMSEEQKQKARDNLKKARELRAKRVKAQTPAPSPTPSPAPVHAPAPAPTQAPAPQGISREDLKQSNLDAIAEYESRRKARKAIKKEAKMVEDHRQEVVKTAQKAVSGWVNTAGKFHGCY
tara:strand:- start:774 stop:1436 length:663 start_codon:yes stop_codon:yes gene_type:complete